MIFLAKKKAINETSEPSKIQKLEAKEFTSFLKSNPFVLIDFYADWCQPCKLQGQILEKYFDMIKKELPDLVIVKMDSDKDGGISTKLEIDSIPNFVLWYKNQIIKLDAGCKDPAEIIAICKALKEELDKPKEEQIKEEESKKEEKK